MDDQPKHTPQGDEALQRLPQELPIVGRSGAGIPLPDLNFPPDPELVAQGWERRFMADPVKAREAVQLYSELGFDVHLAQVKPSELSELCGDCALETCMAYVTIYTRRKPGGL